MIILDTNILISALIKDSITRKIIIESGFNFAYPEIPIIELKKHEPYILKKSGYSKSNYQNILNKLLEYINLIPLDIINPQLKKARKIMEHIDINDTLFIATALSLENSVIWSDDTHFEKQNQIRIVKTKDMIKTFQKSD